MENYNSLESAFSGGYTNLGSMSSGYYNRTINADWF
jgi:hypothetical protein